MSKYIDGDTVFNELTKRYKTATGAERKAYSEAIDIVTAVSEVEIVRCKDCKHADLFYPYCTIWEAAIDGDGFCYKGEKE